MSAIKLTYLFQSVSALPAYFSVAPPGSRKIDQICAGKHSGACNLADAILHLPSVGCVIAAGLAQLFHCFADDWRFVICRRNREAVTRAHCIGLRFMPSVICQSPTICLLGDSDGTLSKY